VCRIASACLALALAAAVAGCTMEKHRQQVREGFFTLGLHRDAFVQEWGPPSRTFSVAAPDPVMRTDAYGSTWQRPVYEVWEYPSHETCLTFDGVRLVYWETGKTDCTPQPPPPREPQAEPAPPYPPRR
jgi:hypothetical protein